MKFIPEIHLQFCIDALSNGASVRMISLEIGVEHHTLSRKLKSLGVNVPTRAESAANTWKNHKHPRIGKKGKDCPVYGKRMSDSTREKMEKIWKKNGDDRRIYRKEHSGGYILIYVPEHPHADRGGYVAEHRYIVEKSLGRYLRSDDIVRHIDGNKKNNDSDNLVVLSRSDHAKLHAKNKKNFNKRSEE